MTEAQRFEDMLKGLKRAPVETGFHPCAWYNHDGDAWEIYLSPEPHVAERVDTLFSVFVSNADREKVTGFVIKNIRKHFGPTGLNQILFDAGRASVRLLLCGALIAQEVEYRKENKPLPPTDRADRIRDILVNLGDMEVDLQNPPIASGV
jgi:hypothetical protein